MQILDVKDLTRPGMMTGQILSGVDPTEAVKYQLLIGFLIAGGAWLLSDGHHRLWLGQLHPIQD